ncbi:ATP-binding protein, partial [Thermodesulfobacteriota bacterium]
VYYRSMKRWLSENVHFKLPLWVKTLGLIGGIVLLLSLIGSVVLKRQVVKKTVQLRQKLEESKQAQKSLQESERKYRTLSSNLPCMVYRARSDWSSEIISNTEIVCDYSVDEFITQKVNWMDLIHPDDKQRVFTEGSRLKEKSMSIVQEYRILDKVGKTRWVRDNKTSFFNEDGLLVGIDGCVFDITAQMKLQAQLSQSQKMEAIGTLTGGVAHDFNNLLTTIIGNAELGLMDLGKDSPQYESLKEIIKAGNSAATLTRQLLAFSRKQILQPTILDLNTVIKDMDKMLQRIIGEDLELTTLPKPDLGKVITDPGQIEQVIMNLVVNARDAMPQGGMITIETANTDLDESYFRDHGIESQIGPYVMLAVSDTGIGMDKETQERIFEPFFTTKGRSKGTGLGLSTVYGVIKQNKGFVWVYSEPEQGTTFKIYLPKVKAYVASEKKEQHHVTELGGSETVLVVEDDDSLRKLARKALQQRGYRVLEAENCEDALRVSEEHEGPIQLMITDVVMPKMSGKETAEHLQPLHPQMKVIYMSGYTDDAIVRHGVLIPGLNFIEKPFTPEGLLRKVREVLDK